MIAKKAQGVAISKQNGGRCPTCHSVVTEHNPPEWPHREGYFVSFVVESQMLILVVFARTRSCISRKGKAWGSVVLGFDYDQMDNNFYHGQYVF